MKFYTIIKSRLIATFITALLLIFVTHSFSQTTITLYPDKDALITTELPDNNYGDWETFGWYLYSSKTSFQSRSFIEFDLSSIPEGAIISNAMLTLYGIHHNGENASYMIRSTEQWDEYGITWNNQPSTYNADWIILEQSTAPDQDYSIDVSIFVQSWIDAAYPNYGLMIRNAIINLQQLNSLTFGSSDHPDIAKRPKLEITFTLPVPPLSITYTSNDLTCEGSNTGAIDIAVTGGETPYFYQWSNGETTEDIHNLYSGFYIITVTDNSGNFTFKAIQINQPLSAETHPNDPQPCSDIFISEYIEGSQQNKVLEFYNPTDEPILLNRYFVRVFINGVPTPLISQLIGTILPGETFVIANPNSGNSILSIADQTSNKLNFNGDDAIQIVKVLNEVPDYDFNGVGGNPHEILNALELDTIDQLGLPYLDPGNQGFPVGNATTKDNTLRRNPKVTHGTQDWDCGQMQWNAVNRGNDFSDLKQYENVCLKSTQDIHFSFENPYESLDTTTGFRIFEFDVAVSSSSTGKYFGGAQFYFRYDTIAFGSDIGYQVDTSISRCTAFNIPTYIDEDYWEIVSDENSNTLRILFSAENGLSNYERVELTSTPVPMLHFKIRIVNCAINSGVLFDTLFPYSAGYTDSSDYPYSGLTPYNGVFFSNSLELVLCKMNITSFTPKVYPGTYYPGTIDNKWEMVITGTNFGEQRGNGNVWFRNANAPNDDDYRIKYTPLDAIDFIPWSDTEIRIRMPSVIDIAILSTEPAGIPGTGKFYIKNHLGDSLMSETAVVMPYAIQNHEYLGKQRMEMVNIENDTIGMIFKISENIFYHPDPMLKIAAERAIYEWACRVQVNFIVDSIPTPKSTTEPDGVNVIHFVDDFPDDSSTLAMATRYHDNCVDINNRRIFFLKEVDIAILKDPSSIRTGTSWYSDTSGTDLPPNQLDFFEVVQHEVGHAVLLQHVIDTFSLMFWTTMFSNTNTIPQFMRRTPVAYDVYGANDVLDKSVLTEYDSTICDKAHSATLVDYTSLPCEQTNSIQIINNDKFDNVKIYPNPFNDGFFIFYELNENSVCEMRIIDIGGRVVDEVGYKKQSKGIYNAYFDASNFESGIYFVNLQINGQTNSYKMIKY